MAIIKSNSYGKTRVRLTYVDRAHVPHRIQELSVAILFEGHFQAVYENGDNANVLPTDTIKNTVYVLARKISWRSIEELAQGLSGHFLERLPQVLQVTVNIEEVPWQRIPDHKTAFVQSGMERRTTQLIAGRSSTALNSGVKGLHILKTAQSAFAGFLHDEFTTLPETHDRLFATVLEAEWNYANRELSFNEMHAQVRTVLLDSFAGHNSLSVQHTLYAMAAAVIDQVEVVAEICLRMPNKHCLLVDLARFGLDNPNMIFVPTDEPSGYIEARVSR